MTQWKIHKASKNNTCIEIFIMLKIATAKFRRGKPTPLEILDLAVIA